MRHSGQRNRRCLPRGQEASCSPTSLWQKQWAQELLQGTAHAEMCVRCDAAAFIAVAAAVKCGARLLSHCNASEPVGAWVGLHQFAAKEIVRRAGPAEREAYAYCFLSSEFSLQVVDI
eukprot:TRINITY_DN32380_c0_g1_i1.p3 TRINITY_DN32380_c0_g1~~TRINITY_DN32380_c0_g1_i1.p3  ORF type:complete len:118 (+),score=8.82 TRINITY_DN32380_c0_g1_i1:178-531(+)